MATIQEKPPASSRDGGGFAIAATHAVALAFGSLDDEVDAAVVVNGLVQLEGECGAGQGDLRAAFVVFIGLYSLLGKHGRI